jgi:hypothetical protein
MSATPTPRRGSALQPFEERLNTRYGVTLELQFKLLKGKTVQYVGLGRTLNISTGGVLFQADDFVEGTTVLEQDRLVVLEINWPCRLEDGCPIKLVARGKIVRRDSNRVALKIFRHEFHTAGARLTNPKVTSANTGSVGVVRSVG